MVSGDFICCLLRTILLYAYTVKIFVYSSKLLFRHFLPTGSDIHRPNFWTFKEPKKRFQRTNSARLCSLAGRYDNPIPTRFLAPKDCLKILRSTVYPMTVNLHTVKAPPTERKEKFTPLWLCQWRKYIEERRGGFHSQCRGNVLLWPKSDESKKCLVLFYLFTFWTICKSRNENWHIRSMHRIN